MSESYPAQQQGLPIAVPVQPTGDTRVDAALERLQELDQIPIEEHAEVFADIHARLTGALGDSGPMVTEGMTTEGMSTEDGKNS